MDNEPVDNLLTRATEFQGQSHHITGQVFAKLSEVYAIYVPVADNTGVLDLSEARGKLVQPWYNPRTGTFDPALKGMAGGKPVALGPPPAEDVEDWAVLFKRSNEYR